MEEPGAERKSEFVTNFEAMIAELADDERHHDFVPVLHRLLTPAVCKRLGLYRYPDSFLLSVVIPIYNEVQTLSAVVHRVRETAVPCEIILVDDGSPDRSWRAIERICDENPRVKGISLSRNFGQHIAITVGLQSSRGDFVVVTGPVPQVGHVEGDKELIAALRQSLSTFRRARPCPQKRRLQLIDLFPEPQDLRRITGKPSAHASLPDRIGPILPQRRVHSVA